MMIGTGKRPGQAHCRGVAMLLVLIAVVLATVLSSAFLSAQATTSGIAANARNHVQARAVAESGLAFVIEYLRAHASWRTDFTHGTWITSQSLCGGTFTIVGEDGQDTDGDGDVDGDGNLADDSTDLVTLTVTGTFNGATHRVSTVITSQSETANPKLLMVVGNASSLSAADTARKAQFETWGWEVTLADDDGSSADLQSSAADRHVVFISNSANATTLGTKLTSSTIGIVTELKGSASNLGLVITTAASSSSKKIDVTDASHYITMVFATGNLDLFTANQSMVSATTANIPTGAQVLAEKPSSSDPTLWLADTGAALTGGTTAAGRRVLLPWADSHPDMTDFTSSGKHVLKRSLEWASSLWPGEGKVFHAATSGTIKIENNGLIDSYDSSQGAYGGSNVASDAQVVTNSTSNGAVELKNNAQLNGDVSVGVGGNPTTIVKNSGTITGDQSAQTENFLTPAPVALPSGFLGNEGSKTLTGTTTISTNRQFDDLVLDKNAIVNISGNVSLRVNKKLETKNNAKIQLNSGATLKVYVQESITFDNNSLINDNTKDPSRVIVYGRGSGFTHKLSNGAIVHAIIDAPTSSLLVDNTAELFGAWIGSSLQVGNTARLHGDDNPALFLANPRLPMIAGTINTGETGGSNAFSVRWVELE